MGNLTKSGQFESQIPAVLSNEEVDSRWLQELDDLTIIKKARRNDLANSDNFNNSSARSHWVPITLTKPRVTEMPAELKFDVEAAAVRFRIITSVKVFVNIRTTHLDMCSM